MFKAGLLRTSWVVLAVLLSGCVMRYQSTDPGNTMPIKTLPSHGAVTVKGEVEAVNSPHKFVLQDKTGSIDVVSNVPILLQPHHEQLIVKGVIKSRHWWQRIIGTRRNIVAKAILYQGQWVKVN